MEPAVNDREDRKTTGLSMWVGVVGACLLVAFVVWLAFAPRDHDTRSVATPAPSTTQTRPAPSAVIPNSGGNTGNGPTNADPRSDSSR